MTAWAGAATTGAAGAAGASATAVPTVSIITRAVPVVTMSSISAAAFERSIILAGTNGPRSLILTVTCLLFCAFVTLTIVPKGRVLCAAVSWPESKISPDDVGRPSNSEPYQEAMPSCLKPAAEETCALTVTVAKNAIKTMDIMVIIRFMLYYRLTGRF